MTAAWIRYYCLCGWLEAAWVLRVAWIYLVAYLIAWGPFILFLGTCVFNGACFAEFQHGHKLLNVDSGESEKLPDGYFKASGTGVGTVMVLLQK